MGKLRPVEDLAQVTQLVDLQSSAPGPLSLFTWRPCCLQLQVSISFRMLWPWGFLSLNLVSFDPAHEPSLLLLFCVSFLFSVEEDK